MKMYAKYATKLTPFVLVGIIPFQCASPILKALTPYLTDGSNGLLTDIIKAIAPLALP